jgi:predicted TIM-barrel fold metal-dependent hydrolase
MQQHLDYWGHASVRLELSPYEYFERQCFVSPFADEALLPHVIAAIGDGNLVYTSDYPYPYVGSEAVTTALTTRTDLDPKSIRRIGSENASRLYGF